MVALVEEGLYQLLLMNGPFGINHVQNIEVRQSLIIQRSSNRLFWSVNSKA